MCQTHWFLGCDWIGNSSPCVAAFKLLKTIHFVGNVHWKVGWVGVIGGRSFPPLLPSRCIIPRIFSPIERGFQQMHHNELEPHLGPVLAGSQQKWAGTLKHIQGAPMIPYAWGLGILLLSTRRGKPRLTLSIWMYFFLRILFRFHTYASYSHEELIYITCQITLSTSYSAFLFVSRRHSWRVQMDKIFSLRFGPLYLYLDPGSSDQIQLGKEMQWSLQGEQLNIMIVHIWKILDFKHSHSAAWIHINSWLFFSLYQNHCQHAFPLGICSRYFTCSRCRPLRF